MSKPHEPVGEPLTIVVPMFGPNHNFDTWVHFVRKRDDGSKVQLIVPPGREPPNIDPAFGSATVAQSDGWGDALQTGLAGLTTPWVAMVSLEAGYSPGDLEKLLKAFHKIDLCVATRDTVARRPWHNAVNTLQRWSARILFGIELESDAAWRGWSAWRSFLIRRVLFGLRLRDAESGLQLWRTAIVEKIPIQSASRFALAELLVKANFIGAIMCEVNVGGSAKQEEVRSDSADFWRVFNQPVFVRPAQGPCG